MPYARDSKDRFFKYTSAETALKILESSAVRYSSPLLFNDPFDVQCGLHFDFDIEALPDIIFRRIEELVTSDQEPAFPDPQDPWATAVTRMWEIKATKGFPSERAREVFGPVLESLKDATTLFQSQYQDHAWRDFLVRLRVFSLSEERDNLLMWAHYAKDHTGAVFVFLVMPKEDNALCAAQPVVYSKCPPFLITKSQILESIFQGKKQNMNILLSDYARVKSDIWQYEKEWRVWYTVQEVSDTMHEELSIRAREIAAIYLGCRMQREKRDEIISLAGARHPAARIFQAVKAPDDFRLDYHSL